MKTKWEFKEFDKSKFDEERKKSSDAHDLFRKKWLDRKDYLEDSSVLREILDEYEKLVRESYGGGNEGYYYWLKQELNLNDVEVRKKFMLIDEFQKKQSEKTLFFHINLGKIVPEKQKEFLENNGLKEYRNFLFQTFENAKHILSENEEKILSLKSSGSYELWVKMVESFLTKETRKVPDEKGIEKELTYNELINLMRSKNKKVRDNAGNALDDIMKKYYDLAEIELNAVLENAKIDDELRGFKRADEERIKSDLIDFEFIDSILSAVKEKFNISKKYYSIVAKLLGQEKLSYHERGVEFFEVEKKYSFEEAVKIVKRVFSKMDSDFVRIFEKMLDEGKIDTYPKPGKNGGAFCVQYRLDDPIYVLLNHSDGLRNVTTLAHEMGHAINGHYMQRNENALNFGEPKSTAEVASTFMEDFVFEEIIGKFGDEEKFYLSLKKISEEISTIYRQIALYLFEIEIHEKYRKEGYLSKERISEIFSEHMSEYLGETFNKETMKYGWVYWSHIRLYFYVYSYASGLLISKSMQEKYRKDNNFIGEIKKFLSTGTSKNPRETFKEMGIVINKEFFLEGLNKIEKELNEVEELGKKLGKL